MKTSKAQFSPIMVSCFSNTTRPCFKVTSAPEGSQFVHFALVNERLYNVFMGIGNGRWEEILTAVKSNKGGYEKNKVKLPCFTPSGIFRTRNDWDLLQYSQVVHLDFDNVDDPGALKARLAKSPYTLAAFTSPGLKGLKTFIRVDTKADDHVRAFGQVKRLFDDLAGIKSDPTARNLSRLCYVASDSEIYINPDAEVFHVSDIVKTTVTVPDPAILSGNSDGLFTFLFNLTQKGKFQGAHFPAGYSRDHRNNFIFLFACNANRYGVPQGQALDYCRMIWVQNNDGFTEPELARTVASAYSHLNEYATFNLPKHLRP